MFIGLALSRNHMNLTTVVPSIYQTENLLSDVLFMFDMDARDFDLGNVSRELVAAGLVSL